MAAVSAVKVLGHVAIERDGRTNAVAGRTLAVLLAVFASRANRRVVTETLVEALWSDNTKRSRATLQVHINRLRDLLGEERPPAMLVTVPGGYRLVVAPDELDTLDFEDRVTRAAHALRQGNPVGAARTLENALRDWAEPFGDLADHPLLLVESTRLRELRETAEEDLCDALLELGRNNEAIERLTRLTEEEPLRERRWGQRILALYRAGRQAEALRCYQDIRRVLGDELGVEPSPQLRRLEEAILLHDQRLQLTNRAAAVRPSNNLPPMTPIIGRQDATTTVRSLLTSSRLVTIAGHGGVGKTRLALAVAHRLLDDLPDGVYLVPLDGVRDGALVASAVADSLGLIGADGTEVIDAIHANLASNDVVILLDNAEHVRSDTAVVVERLLERSPNVRILVTSRRPLDVDGEAVYRVPPLAVPAPEATIDERMSSSAVQLFLARAERSLGTHHTTIDAVTEICRELGGLPLAIELAAARTSAMAPADVLARLSAQLELLRSTRPVEVTRHQSIERSIEWSFALLAADEQELLCRLGVFRGGFSFAGCQAVVVDDALTGVRVIDLLERLVHMSLLTVGETGRETWFTISASLAEYGRRRLAAAGTLAHFEARHRDYCADLSFHASRNVVSKADTMIPIVHHEHNNIRAALRWSIDRGDGREAVEIAAAMSIFWNIHGYIREGRRWLAEVRDMATPDVPISRARLAQASALLASADVAYDQADAWFAEADSAYDHAGYEGLFAWNRFWWARTLVSRAFLGHGTHELLDRAAHLYATSLQQFREAVDWAGLMSVLPFAAIAETVKGSDAAEPYLLEAERIARLFENDRAAAIAAKSRALEALRSGDAETAVQQAQSSADVLGRLRDRHNEVVSRCVESLAYLQLHDAGSAGAAARDALRLHRRHGNREYAPFVLAVAWVALDALGHPEAHSTREALDLMHPWWPTPLRTLGIDVDGGTPPPRDGFVALRWPTGGPVFKRALDALSR